MTAPVFVAGQIGTTAFTDTVTITGVDGGSASGRCILALLWGYGDSSGTITGAKCNGTAMTSCAAVQNSSTGVYKYQMFKMVSDSTITTGATNTIEADFAGGVITHGIVMAASFSGVSAVSAGIAASLGNQSPSWGTISGATGDLAVALALSDNNVGHTWTGGTGVTKDFDSTTTIFVPGYVLEKASAASVTVDATISGSGDGWLGVGVSLAAVSGGGGITAPAQSLSLTDQAPTLMAPVAAPAQSVVLTNLAPTIPRLAPVQSVVLTNLAPTLLASIVPPLASIVLTPLAPGITGTGLSAPFASLVLNSAVPSLMASIFVPVASITLTPQGPTITPSSGGGGNVAGGTTASGGGARLSGGKPPKLEEYPLFQELDKAIAEGRSIADFLAPPPAVLPPPVADAIVAPMPIAMSPPDDDDEEDLLRLLPGVL